MNCAVCSQDFNASEKAVIKERANDTVFIHTYCPACKQQYYAHTHFGEWVLVTTAYGKPVSLVKVPSQEEAK